MELSQLHKVRATFAALKPRSRRCIPWCCYCASCSIQAAIFPPRSLYECTFVRIFQIGKFHLGFGAWVYNRRGYPWHVFGWKVLRCPIEVGGQIALRFHNPDEESGLGILSQRGGWMFWLRTRLNCFRKGSRGRTAFRLWALVRRRRPGRGGEGLCNIVVTITLHEGKGVQGMIPFSWRRQEMGSSYWRPGLCTVRFISTTSYIYVSSSHYSIPNSPQPKNLPKTRRERPKPTKTSLLDPHPPRTHLLTQQHPPPHQRQIMPPPHIYSQTSPGYLAPTSPSTSSSNSPTCPAHQPSPQTPVAAPGGGGLTYPRRR